MMAARAKATSHWTADLTAGLATGIANIPDAMASAILAGNKTCADVTQRTPEACACKDEPAGS